MALNVPTCLRTAWRAFVLALGLSLPLAQCAPAAPLAPKPGADWAWALRQAKPGETIRLQTGEYPSLAVSGPAYDKVGGVVTILSQPGTVIRGLKIESAGGYLVKGGTFIPSISLRKARDITLDGIKVMKQEGLTPEEVRLTSTVGVRITESVGIKVLRSEFSNLGFGVAHLRSRDILIADNTFRNISQDGVRGASSDIEISRNTFTDFYACTQPDGNRCHFDAIQFWTANVKEPLSNIRIRDNRVLRGKGDTMTALQMGDEADRWQRVDWKVINVGYKDLEISGNMFAGGGKCINVEGAIEPKVHGNLCAGTTEDTHFVRAKTGEMKRAGIRAGITLTHGIGGDVYNNAGPAPPNTYKPITPARIRDNKVDGKYRSGPGDYSRAESWWAGRKGAREAAQ